MKPDPIISDCRLLGFYQLKKLLGLGDDRLRMILTVGNVEPIMFGAPGSDRQDKLYSLFSVKEALLRLQGRDVQQEYENNYQPALIDIESKVENVQLRLYKSRRKAANGSK